MLQHNGETKSIRATSILPYDGKTRSIWAKNFSRSCFQVSTVSCSYVNIVPHWMGQIKSMGLNTKLEFLPNSLRFWIRLVLSFRFRPIMLSVGWYQSLDSDRGARVTYEKKVHGFKYKFGAFQLYI